MTSTRTKHEHWLIGAVTSVLKEEFITRDLSDKSMDLASSLPFSGPLQLPTKMQALKLFWFFKDEIGRYNNWSLTKGDLEGIVARIVIHYWRNLAAYDTVDPSTAQRQVKRLVDLYQKLQKNQAKNQPKANRDREAFLADLKTCLNVGATGLRDSLMKDRVRSNLNLVSEDVEFLDDQLGPRLKAMSHKPDKEFNDRKAANLKRKYASAVSSPGQSSATESPANVDDIAADYDDEAEKQEENNNNDNDPDFITPSKKGRSDRITVSIQRHVFMSPDLISSLDRSKTSDHNVMRTFSSLFKTFQTVDGRPVSLTEFVMSRSTISRSRKEQRNIIADEEKVKFKKNMPLYLTLGWDSKLIQDMMNAKHEMECIVVSGAPQYTEGKIIDVVELTDEDGRPTSTGLAQAEAVFDTIQDWGVSDNIVAYNFDTTASNTGPYSGAAIRLNFLQDKPVFYLACRHHMIDLLAKNTYTKVMGYDPSPDVAIFKRMKDVFPNIDTQGSFMVFDVDNKEELIELFTNILTKLNANGELFVREDYRELCEISLVMCGGSLPDGKVMRWRAPGAAHKARFMAFGLCSLKILAFSHLQEVRDRCFSKKVKKGLIFEADTLQNLWRWGQYAIKYYVPSFLLATLGRDAPSNDLNLFKATIQYREVDEELADSALDTLSRHRWYLTGEVVPFSLFSDNVNEDEKRRIAARLLSTQREETVSLGLPNFPVVTETTELWDLVTPASWKFFDILKSDPNWLTQNVSEWERSPDYRQLKSFVSTVKTVNDGCERAVALATDYARILTKDASMRRKILQVVEANRKAFTDVNKATLDKQGESNSQN